MCLNGNAELVDIDRSTAARSWSSGLTKYLPAARLTTKSVSMIAKYNSVEGTFSHLRGREEMEDLIDDYILGWPAKCALWFP